MKEGRDGKGGMGRDGKGGVEEGEKRVRRGGNKDMYKHIICSCEGLSTCLPTTSSTRLETSCFSSSFSATRSYATV